MASLSLDFGVARDLCLFRGGKRGSEFSPACSDSERLEGLSILGEIGGDDDNVDGGDEGDIAVKFDFWRFFEP